MCRDSPGHLLPLGLPTIGRTPVLRKTDIFRQKVQIHKGGLADISDKLLSTPHGKVPEGG